METRVLNHFNSPCKAFVGLCLLSGLLVLTEVRAQNRKWVNVFIGTEGTGHTFPGPSRPFGMVQPGPDNQNTGWAYTSGYQYRDTALLGFSQTRFSGTGIPEMGDVLLLPINPKKEKAARSYSKKTESARVGYYQLTKNDEVKVELTCSERVAFHRYTFPGKKGQVLLDLRHGLRFMMDPNTKEPLVVKGEVKMENDHTFSGYCSTKNWVNRTYYFTLDFDQPFEIQKHPNKARSPGPNFLLDFNLPKHKTLQVKIALSTVSINGARRNLNTEIPHWNFERVVQENEAAWDQYLNRIDIEAPDAQKSIFYTSLYHLLLQPSNIADVNGEYRGADQKIQKAPGKAYYSTLSIWDIYRGAFPLLQMVAPERIDGIVQTLLLHHKAAGFLPIWTAWGQDNYCMIGNHAIPMLLSAYQNGFRGFNPKEALKAMVETSTRSHINSNWELYKRYSYYPFDSLDNEAVSRTLETSYDDWCVAEMAQKLGDIRTAETFRKRSAFHRNLFDFRTNLFRGRDSKGNWREPFFPLKATSPLNNPGDYTEANAWQYLWTPFQHDLKQMIQDLGGDDLFTLKLDSFFTLQAENPDKFLGQEAMIGQYAHGNEPSHHILYLYPFSKKPERGQALIHQVVREFHKNAPDGMIGNDDCGQMSAWYILSCLGFYPVNPASGEFVLGSPQLKSATLKLPGGKEFRIEARNFSEQAIYNKNRFLNGKGHFYPVITYSDIMQGGSLQFDMYAK